MKQASWWRFLGRVPAEIGLAAALLPVSVVVYLLDSPLAASLAPDSTDDNFRTLWTVYATTVGLTLPLLVLIIELSRGLGPMAASRSEVVMDATRARPLLIAALIGLVEFGVAAVYLDRDAVLLMHIAVFAALLGRLGFAYWQAIRLLTDPYGLAERSRTYLVRKLDAAIHEERSFSEQNSAIARELDPLLVDWSGGRMAPPQRGMDAAAVFPLESGHVREIDAALLKGVLIGIIENSRSEGFERSASSGPVPRFTLAGVGDAAGERRPLLTVSGPLQSVEGHQDSVRACFVVGSDLVANVGEQMRGLIEEILQAIARRSIPAIESGLSLCRAVVVSSDSKALEPDHLSVGLARQLRDDIELLSRRSLATGDDDVLRTMSEFIYGVIADSSAIGDEGALRLGIDFFGLVWGTRPRMDDQGLTHSGATATNGLTVSFYHAREIDDLTPSSEDRASAMVLESMAAGVRHALADGEIDAASEMASSLRALGRYWNDSPDIATLRTAALVEMYVLALDAFVLVRSQRGRSGEHVAKEYAALARSSAFEVGWDAYFSLMSDRQRFDFWPIELLPRTQRVGSLGFKSEVVTAFALRLLTLGNWAELPSRELLRQVPKEARLYALRELREHLDSVRLRDRAEELSIQLRPGIRARGRIDLEISQLSRTIATEVAESPLSVDAIESFREAVLDGWYRCDTSPTPEQSALRELATVATVPDSRPIDERLAYGAPELVPKPFFVELDTGNARDVGLRMGKELARTEQDLGVAALLGLEPVDASDDLVGSLRSVVDDLDGAAARDAGHARNAVDLVVVNNFERFQTISRAFSGIDGSAVNVVSFHTRVPDEFVVVGYLGAVLHLRRLPNQLVHSWEDLQGNDDELVVGVSAISGPRALALIEKDPAFLQAPGGGGVESIDEAALRLQGLVEIQVRTRFEWDLSESHSQFAKLIVPSESLDLDG